MDEFRYYVTHKVYKLISYLIKVFLYFRMGDGFSNLKSKVGKLQFKIRCIYNRHDNILPWPMGIALLFNFIFNHSSLLIYYQIMFIVNSADITQNPSFNRPRTYHTKREENKRTRKGRFPLILLEDLWCAASQVNWKWWYLIGK